MLGLRLTLGAVATVLRSLANSLLPPGKMDFSAPDNSALIALLEDI